MKKDRIQKVLSENGIMSRRKVESLIIDKKVKVNGRYAKIGMKIDPAKDLVDINGERVTLLKKQSKYYVMLNKPRGYITTMKDEKDRKCVLDLLKDFPTRIYPIGRLDKESEGLLLFTNDGDFHNSICHPSKHISKLYRVTVDSLISDEDLVKLSEGVLIDGKKTLPAIINVISAESNRSVFEMSIKEGKNRQIRKMCESVKLNVIRLKRLSIGPIKLGFLKVGKYRDLKPFELIAIRNAIGGSVNK